MQRSLHSRRAPCRVHAPLTPRLSEYSCCHQIIFGSTRADYCFFSFATLPLIAGSLSRIIRTLHISCLFWITTLIHIDNFILKSRWLSLKLYLFGTIQYDFYTELSCFCSDMITSYHGFCTKIDWADYRRFHDKLYVSVLFLCDQKSRR